MILTEKEQKIIEAYRQEKDPSIKLGVDKLLDVKPPLPEIPDFVKEKLNLPPYPVLKDVKYWITAMTDDFKADGIEKGDLLGCCSSFNNDDEECDEPKFIHILNMPGSKFDDCFDLGKIDFKTDYGESGFMIYLNSEFTKKTFVSADDMFTKVKDIGIVKLVLKCKEL